MAENELMHYGTKGMRWGIRRYQNKDGTLTPAGKKRYDKELAKLKAEEAVVKNYQRTRAKFQKLDDRKAKLEKDKEDLKKSPKPEEPVKKTPSKPKSVSEMSNDELRDAITRMQLEQQYRQLNPQKVSKGKQFVEGTMNKVIKPAVSEASKNLLRDYLNKAGKEILGLNEQPDAMAKLDKEVKKMRLEKEYKDLKSGGSSLKEKYEKAKLENKLAEEEEKAKNRNNTNNSSKNTSNDSDSKKTEKKIKELEKKIEELEEELDKD